MKLRKLSFSKESVKQHEESLLTRFERHRFLINSGLYGNYLRQLKMNVRKNKLVVYVDGEECQHKEPGDGTVWVKMGTRWVHIAMERSYK